MIRLYYSNNNCQLRSFSFDSSKMYSLCKQLNPQVAHKHTIKPNEWLTLRALNESSAALHDIDCVSHSTISMAESHCSEMEL